MKRGVYIAIIILVTFGLASAAFADKKKPQRQACWEVDGDGPFDSDILLLGIKSSGIKIKTADGNVKFYDVSGVFITDGENISPVHGTGYMSNMMDPYYFASSLTGENVAGAYHIEFIYDLNSPDSSWVYIDRGDSTAEERYDLIPVDCKGFDIVNE